MNVSIWIAVALVAIGVTLFGVYIGNKQKKQDQQ
jgi:hypothetical protein